MNSKPLSVRISLGRLRSSIIRLSTAATRFLVIELSTSNARHSRVASSITFKTRMWVSRWSITCKCRSPKHFHRLANRVSRSIIYLSSASSTGTYCLPLRPKSDKPARSALTELVHLLYLFPDAALLGTLYLFFARTRSLENMIIQNEVRHKSLLADDFPLPTASDVLPRCHPPHRICFSNDKMSARKYCIPEQCQLPFFLLHVLLKF